MIIDSESPSKEKKVTIKQLQEEAIRNHPAYKIAENAIEAERGVRTQASLRPNPQLRYQGEEVGADGKAGKQGFTIEQEFGTNKRRALLIQRSDRALETLDWNKQIAIAKIRNDVRSLADRVLIAQKKVEIHRQLASISQAAEDNAKEAITAGSVEITRLHFIQLQNQTRQAKLTLVQELNAKDALEKKLAVMIGSPDEPIGEIADDPETLGDDEQLSESDTLDAILERSPEIARKRAEIQEKQAALAFERSPRKEITIEGGALYDFADNTTLAQVGIGMPIRVNNRNEGNIQRATAEYYAAQRELEKVQLKLRADFADIYSTYKSARAEVQAYQQGILPDLEKLFSMSQQAYRQGQINFLEISAARAAYIESSVNYLEALERLAESIVKIEGELLENSLD
ncbi:MAG: TolC family protein [Thermoguttaceae bacterium]|nr:TolC family protein [Thermoguttaceae bacterium]